MKYQPIPKSLFEQNRKNFSAKMKSGSIAIFHSNDEYPRNGDHFFPFRQQSDFFYLTGIDQEKSILILAPDHPEPNNREILFVIKTNKQIEIWNGHKFSKQEATEVSGIGSVKWLDEYPLVLRDMMGWAAHVYLNSYEYPKYSTDVETRELREAHALKQQFPAHSYKRSAPILTGLRMIKSETEIQLIRKAIDITEKALRRVLKFVKPGVMEYQIQAEMEHEFAMNGANGSAFSPIVASGANSCVLHYTENDKTCRDGDVVLFDFGAEYAYYAADISRTIPVNGKFTERQRRLYELVMRVQDKAIGQMVPGNTLAEYTNFVNRTMEEEMIGIGLLDAEAVKNQDPDQPLYKEYFMHGTAHHIGLDVHDVIDRHAPFKAGMIFTCEPGIYLREEGIGIRLENNILITDSGPLDLSAGIPRDPGEIEDLMK
ncbi:MAG: aminopeptidase P N-terminal domain-containing protein [Bacteroidales bacterium]